MQLLAHLRRAGWFELTRPYPDRGSLDDVDWYTAPLRIGIGGAGAIVSANAEGLRLVVGSGLSALFVPWSEVTVSGEREWIDTVIRLQTRAVPSLPLVLHLEDDEADALLRPAGLTLPARRWRWGPWLFVIAACGVLLALLGTALLVAKRQH
jgi:hypothetical protein